MGCCNLTVGFLHAGCEEGGIGREIEGRVPLPIPALFLFYYFFFGKQSKAKHAFSSKKKAKHAFIHREN